MAEEHAWSNSTPLRPPASPRQTPPSSPTMLALDPLIDGPGDVHASLSSREHSPLRGRTTYRNPPESRSVYCATARRSIHLEPIHSKEKERLINLDLTKTRSEPEASPLEPLPIDRFRQSLSEELHRAATLDSTIDLGTFSGHRDSYQLLKLRKRHDISSNMPLMILAQILQYLDNESYKAVRLTCHSWSVAVTRTHQTVTPSVAMLPSEILEKVYTALSPTDFNAARHTCRTWMLASLDQRLLIMMLKHGNWFRALLADCEVVKNDEANRRVRIVNDEWFLSKRLATECSLGPHWSGNGVEKHQSLSTGLRLTSQIDFTQLEVHPDEPPTDHDSHEMPRFIVSTCRKFVLALKLRSIYVYSLLKVPSDGNPQPYGGRFELLTTIPCPGYVLTASMDTSSHHYAIAALLQGSIGIVCIFEPFGSTTLWKGTDASQAAPGISHGAQGSVSIPMFLCRLFAHTDPRNRAEYCQSPKAILSEICGKACEPEIWASGNQIDPQIYGTASGAYASFRARKISSPSAVYRNLCPIDDPPRSVAICSRRRCVAFGCQSGVELHWPDALTGQNLRRWFPLLSPASHLYFMPARDGVDKSGKLRLIPSREHPITVRNTSQIYAADDHPVGNSEDCDSNGIRHITSNFFSQSGAQNYGALPLNDGQHLLVTLPSGELCLVKDNPPSQDLEKITRRFTFVGPMNDRGIPIIPSTYATAAELQWGVRVAAAFEDQLWFFVVPADLFFECGSLSSRADASSQHGGDMSGPLRIQGVKIANIADLTCITLDGSFGDLTLWAFSSTTNAGVFQVAGSCGKAVTQRIAAADGNIMLVKDADGDTVVLDAPESPEGQTPQCDNTMSFTQDYPSSCVPCFPTCSHPYCNLLLSADNGTFPTGSINPHYITSTLSRADYDISISPRNNVSLEDHPSPLWHRSLLEDEGYASMDDDEDTAEGSPSAIYVPPLSDRWNCRVGLEWVPECVMENGTGTEDEGFGLDPIEMCRCECEIVGI